jgi:hypothetical protein
LGQLPIAKLSFDDWHHFGNLAWGFGNDFAGKSCELTLIPLLVSPVRATQASRSKVIPMFPVAPQTRSTCVTSVVTWTACPGGNPAMQAPQAFGRQAYGQQMPMPMSAPMPQPAYPAWAQQGAQENLSGYFAQPPARMTAPMPNSMPVPMPGRMPQAQAYMAQAQYMQQVQQFQQMQQMQQSLQMAQMASMQRMAHQQQQLPVAMGASVSPLRCIPANVNYNPLPVGEQPLHDGRYKVVMPLLVPQTGQLSGHVLVVEKDRSPQITREEVQGLADLQEMGFPVPPIQSTGSYRGHSAKLMPQMLPVHLGPDGLVNSPYATPATFESLQAILRQIDANRISLESLQLLMNPADGRLYVSGPAGVNVEIDHFTSESLPSRSGTGEKHGMRESLRRALDALRQRFGGGGGIR